LDAGPASCREVHRTDRRIAVPAGDASRSS
jgi:hypothetical protein